MSARLSKIALLATAIAVVILLWMAPWLWQAKLHEVCVVSKSHPHYGRVVTVTEYQMEHGAGQYAEEGNPICRP